MNDHSITKFISDIKSISRTNWLAFLLLVILVSVFLFFTLQHISTIPIPSNDEAILIQSCNKTLTSFDSSHSLTTSTDEFSIPKYLLNLTIFFKMFGIGLIQARLFNIITSSSLLIFIFLIGRKFHSNTVGLLAVLFLSINAFFFHNSRISNIDTSAIASSLLAFYLYFRAQTSVAPYKQLTLGTLAGALTVLSIITNPSGIYVPFAIFLWALIEHKWNLYKNFTWLSFISTVLLLFTTHNIANPSLYWWYVNSIFHKNINLAQFLEKIKNIYSEPTYSNVLDIATPTSTSIYLFQLGVLLSTTYFITYTAYKFLKTKQLRTFLLSATKGKIKLQNTEELVQRNTGSLQVWLVEQGGWKKKLLIALKEIEKGSKPITTWIQALSFHSDNYWKNLYAGLLAIVLTATIFFILIDTQSGIILGHLLPWCSIYCSISIVDAISWSVKQRTRSTRRVLMGLGLLIPVLVLSVSYVGESSRNLWRFYRWSNTFNLASYSDLVAVLHDVIPKEIPIAGRPIYWLAFNNENSRYLSIYKRSWPQQMIPSQPYALIVDKELLEKERTSGLLTKHFGNLVLLAELSNTLYGDIKIFYTGKDTKYNPLPPTHYYFFGDPQKGYGIKGHYSEEQRQTAKVIWSATPQELEQITKSSSLYTILLPTLQRDGDRLALRIVTDISNYNTRIRIPLPLLKPLTIYKLQVATRVAEGGCLIGPRDRTGTWLVEPIVIKEAETYSSIDIAFVTNERGDGELAISNLRNQPAASLIYLNQIELREIGPRP